MQRIICSENSPNVSPLRIGYVGWLSQMRSAWYPHPMKKRAWLNSRLVGVTAVAFWRTLFLYSCVWKQLAADILCWSSISGCWFFLLGGRCIGSSPSDNSVVPMTPSVSLAVRAWSWLQGQLSRNRGTGAGWPVIES